MNRDVEHDRDHPARIARRNPPPCLGPNWRATDDAEAVPAVTGVYAAYVDGVLVYVGSSRNMRLRLYAHGIRRTRGGQTCTPWGTCQAVYFKYRTVRKFGAELMLEARLIRRLVPLFNTSGITREQAAENRSRHTDFHYTLI